MKIFISWSGDISRQIANELRDWLPYVLQGIKPFITTSDIEKGAKWLTDILIELEGSNYGLVCLTPQNLDSQWIAFEAGALSKHLNGRVSTVLFGLQPNALSLPLSMFQATVFDKKDVRSLVDDMNSRLDPELQRSTEQLTKLFERFWPDLNESIGLILQTAGAAPQQPQPTAVETMQMEVMAMLRQQSAVLNKIVANTSQVTGPVPAAPTDRSVFWEAHSIVLERPSTISSDEYHQRVVEIARRLALPLRRVETETETSVRLSFLRPVDSVVMAQFLTTIGDGRVLEAGPTPTREARKRKPKSRPEYPA